MQGQVAARKAGENAKTLRYLQGQGHSHRQQDCRRDVLGL